MRNFLVTVLTLLAAGGVQAQTCNLQYFGGPVISNARVNVVFWTGNVDAQEKANVGSFLGDLLNSPYIDGLSEYNTVGLTAQDGNPGTSQGIGRGSYAGSFTITTPAVCANASSGSPCTVTDAQIEAQLRASILDGTLPAPVPDEFGYVRDTYEVLFPPYVTFMLSNGSTSCTTLCYYHTLTATPDGGLGLSYGAIPDMSAVSPCSTGCGGTDPLTSLTSTLSREIAEVMTDPSITTTTSAVGRPLGWYANANGGLSCGEIGDICMGANRSGTLVVGVDTWTVQKVWSNKFAQCLVTSPSFAPICTAPGVPAGCRPCSYSDDGNGCSGSTPVCEVDAGNAHAGTCVGCRSDAQCPGSTCDRSADTCRPVVHDAGSTDGGTQDGGTTDAGAVTPDGGGTGQDAGTHADAGPGGGTPSKGCGCGTTGPSAWGILAAFALALVARRARSSSPQVS